MLKKVIAILASKYLAFKAKMRAIETRLIIHSLLLRDKKGLQHLFRQKKCLNLLNTVDGEDYQSDNFATIINNSIAATHVSILQLAEDKMEIEEDDEWPDGYHKHPNTVEDEDCQSDKNNNPTNKSTGANPEEMGIEEDNEYPDLRHSFFEDNEMEDHSTSIIEMVKNAKEVQGKEFRLEDDIDQVADLFIRRFHHQIRLQKLHLEPSPSYSPV